MRPYIRDEDSFVTRKDTNYRVEERMSSEHVPECRNRSSWRPGDSSREVTGVYDDEKRTVGGLFVQDSRQL